MSVNSGGKIVKNGLIFAYDMNDRNSWKGKPTTNLCYQRNPIGRGNRKDYLKSTNSSDATYNSNHPGRIKFTLAGGGGIGDMINSGVNSGNWQVTYHAHWQYDEELRKPVCVMNDVDGQWKAHSFGTGYTLNSLGWSEGQQYTISWLGWTTRIDKAPQAGIYYRRLSDLGRGFYAGQSNSQSTAKNTEPYKWQRLYATFTVPAAMDGTYGLGIYCYGHYTGRGTVKMVDLQWEEGLPSHFVENAGRPYQTRSNTDALIDLTGNNTITADGLSYNSDGTFSFNSSLLSTTIGSGRNVASNPITIQAFVKSNTTSGARMWIDVTGNGTNQRLYSTLNAVGQSSGMGIQGSGWDSSIPIDTNWHYQAIVLDGSTATAYDNGVVASSKAYTSYTLPGNIIVGGRSGYYWSGEISAFSVYDRALTADEITTNFNALRVRYGI